MPERPALQDEQIIHCLRDEYGLDVERISSLALGADVDSSVYRVITKHGKDYFLKSRKGNFNEASVIIPSYLSAAGIQQVIPPLRTQKDRLWADIDPFKVILYPFVEGQAALDIKMTEGQWIEFGTALKRFHTTEFPATLTRSIPKDDFSSRWWDMVNLHLERVEAQVFREPLQGEAAAFLRSKRAETLEVAKRAQQLAQMVQDDLPEFVLCHSDIHGYNLLIDNQGALYIVDWDGLVFAPRERDLMFIGGGHGHSGYTPREEEAMFYQGYGETNINQIALAYYRYERIILDIVDDCDIIFLSEEGEDVQTGALEDLNNKFSPDSYIEIAYRSDQVLKK
jgi:spectinomycin phosphotransferase